MPLYDFEDTETGEVFELRLKIAEREDFLKVNPKIRQVISAPNIVGGIDGLRKVDDGFKEVLSKVAEQNPQSNFGREVNSAKTNRQGAVNKAVDKWKKSSTYRKAHQK